MVAPFSPSCRLQGGCRAGKADPLLWTISGSGGRGLEWLETSLDICFPRPDRIPPGLGLDGLCHELLIHLTGWQMDWCSGLRLLRGNFGPRPWSLAVAQIGSDHSAAIGSAALGDARPFAMAGDVSA